MNNKITFPELIERIAGLTNTSKRVSELFLKELFGVVKECLEQGVSVKIKNLGTFKVTEIATRKSVNVNTGEEMEIPAHRRVSFTPDKTLAEAINAPFEGFETVILDDDVSEADLQELSAIDEGKISKEDVEIAEEILPPLYDKDVTMMTSNSDDSIDSSLDLNKEESQEKEELHVGDEGNNVSKEDVEPVVTNNVEEQVDNVDEAIAPISTIAEDENFDEYEEVKSEKRKSFMWGFLGGILVCILIGVVAIGVCDSCFGDFVPYSRTEKVITDSIETSPKLVDTVSHKKDSVIEIKENAPVVITDTVRADYYLTKMSRKYYGRYEFWVYIYMENKGKISNPNKVSPGLVVVIPAPEKYGIDKNSEESVQKAKELAEKIL